MEWQSLQLTGEVPLWAIERVLSRYGGIPRCFPPISAEPTRPRTHRACPKVQPEGQLWGGFLSEAE